MKTTAPPPTPEAVVQLRLAEVLPAADNVRVNVGDVTELAASIAQVGILEPLIVTQPAAINGRLQAYRVVVGHRRLAAAKLAGIPTVPAIIRELTDRERIEAMLVENLQRQDLTPLEEAEAYRRLTELELGQVEIAKRIGRSQAHVSKRLALLKLPDVARTALAAGKLPVADALELAHYAGEPEVIAKVLADGFYPGNAGRSAEAVKRNLDAARKRQTALEQLAAAKVSIISSDGWAPKGGPYFSLERGAWGGLPMSVAAHAKHPCHAAWVDHDARIRYVCTKPATHLKDPSKAIAKAAKQLAAKGGKSNTTKEGRAAQAKAAEMRERNKALRVAAPIRRKLAGRLITSKIRREALEFALRQLIQTALLGVKATDRDGDPSFRSYAAPPAKVDQLAYALGLALGEISFGTLDTRNYFDEEFAAHAARYFAHLKTAGNYKATPTELAQIKPSGWRPSWDGAGK